MEIKTINDLRIIMAEEIQRIRDGKTTAANVNAITNAAGKILSSVKLELEYNKIQGRTTQIAFINPSNDNEKAIKSEPQIEIKED